MKRFINVILTILLVMTITGCGAKGSTAEVEDTNGDAKLTCTLEVRCDTLLAQLDKLQKDKAALVPKDGVILKETEIEFEAGASVFDVFRKVLKEQKIHFEYTDASMYDTVYIEGIANLYEFDCGKQSGWMFSVNDTYPGLGCSSYTLSDGDSISFRYTCNLGADLGAKKVNEK